LREAEYKRVVTLTFTHDKVVIEDDGYIVDVIELHGISPQLVAGRFTRDVKETIKGIIVFLKVWESIKVE